MACGHRPSKSRLLDLSWRFTSAITEAIRLAACGTIRCSGGFGGTPETEVNANCASLAFLRSSLH